MESNKQAIKKKKLDEEEVNEKSYLKNQAWPM